MKRIYCILGYSFNGSLNSHHTLISLQYSAQVSSILTPYDCIQNLQVHVMLNHREHSKTASQTPATGFKQVKNERAPSLAG